MLIGETLRVAIGAIRANKLRSFLTMLGIIIGIAAVITMIALGEGAQRAVEARLAQLGTNVLTVRPGQEFFGGIDRGENRLTVRSAEALLENPVNIAAVSPEMQRRHQVVYGGANSNSQIVGVWPSYFAIHNHKVAAGRIFTEGEDRGRRRVAVLGAAVGERLGISDTRELVDKTIRIRGIPFEVIGVLEPKGDQGFMNPDANIYIPLATAQFRIFGTDRVGAIYVQAVSEDAMDPAIAEIDTKIRRVHRLRPGQPSNFNIRNQTTLLSTFQETTRTFTFLLAGIAAVSLLVGGIGIMNIMLVSVTERTREIGIRKALGARRRDILLQFLIEALVLCLAGGAIGLAAGIGGAHALQRLANWNTAVAPEAVGLAFGFAAFVGIFFGLWPARRAASLDPIIALRYE
ncbi:MAG TPA: ABC transporter permease [Longimicrobiales bacterium]|nr:ABC transporter permease [Longimicrobiales bacterium]